MEDYEDDDDDHGHGDDKGDDMEKEYEGRESTLTETVAPDDEIILYEGWLTATEGIITSRRKKDAYSGGRVLSEWRKIYFVVVCKESRSHESGRILCFLPSIRMISGLAPTASNNIQKEWATQGAKDEVIHIDAGEKSKNLDVSLLNLQSLGFSLGGQIDFSEIKSVTNTKERRRTGITEDRGECKLVTPTGSHSVAASILELSKFISSFKALVSDKSVLSTRSVNASGSAVLPKKIGKLVISSIGNSTAPSDTKAYARDKTIDEMKVQTMFKMVEDVTVSIDGREFEKKLLYLTNKQCSMFDEIGILRCIQALDLGEPKCIIRLMFSGGSSYLYQANAQAHMQRLGQWGTYCINGADINAKDNSEFIQQAILLMRNCIIPLAKETRALIIINASTNCLLGNVLSEVAIPEQERLGKNCPFKILGLVNGNPFMTHAAVKGIGVAGDLAKGSDVWQQRMPVVLEHFGEQDESAYFRVNCTKAASHYIIFECIDFDVAPSKLNYGPANRFQNLVASALSRNLPSVAFCCSNGATNGALVEVGGNDWEVTMGLLKMGVPVLFLDLRLRAFSCQRPGDATSHLSDLAKRANQFPRLTARDIAKIKFKSDDGYLSFKSRKFLLKIAFQMLESHHECILANDSFDRWYYSTFAFIHSVLTIGTHKINANDDVQLHECISYMMHSDSERQQETIPYPLIVEATCFLLRRIGVQARLQRKKRLETWLASHPENVDHLEEEARKEYQLLVKECNFLENECEGMDPVVDHQQWLALTEILMNHSTYSASLYDLKAVNSIIRKVAKIDRLPDANSLEVNMMIRDAWDHVDIYHAKAKTYKVLSKLTYMSLLVIGIVITTLSTLILVEGNCSEEYGVNSSLILYVSLIGSMIAAFITFMNPAQKWQQLRGAALSIESILWQYRTRTGCYRVQTDDFEIDSFQLFQLHVNSIKEYVMEGADIKKSSFFGATKSPNNHGQHPTAYNNNINKVEPSIRSMKAAAAVTGEHEASFDESDDGCRIVPLRIKTNADGSANLLDVLLAIKKHHVTRRERSRSYDSYGHSDVSHDGEEEYEENGIDSHYLPVGPDQYCEFRIIKAIKHYKSRIPGYNRARYIGQILFMLGSISTTLLAISNYTHWAALSAICCSSITAWQEFQNTNDKIMRYSSTVADLERLLLWWRTCAPIERASTSHVDRLVQTAEDTIKKDHGAWASKNDVATLLGKATEKQASYSAHT